MTLVQRLTASVRANGFSATAAKCRSMVVDRWFDFQYGLNTCSCSDLDELTITADHKANGYLYKPVRILPLRRFFKALRPLLPRDSVLVDFGSGKARVLMVGAEFGFRAARGVEFAKELCEISQRNCEHYSARAKTATEFSTVEMDAAKYEIRPDENVFIMCNPFDDAIVKAVLENIAASVRETPRQVWIAYYNPKWKHVIEQQKDFPKAEEFNFWGHRFALYSNARKALTPGELEGLPVLAKSLVAGLYLSAENLAEVVELVC